MVPVTRSRLTPWIPDQEDGKGGSAVKSEVKYGARQPVWNCPHDIVCENAYCVLEFTLMCQHPQKREREAEARKVMSLSP